MVIHSGDGYEFHKIQACGNDFILADQALSKENLAAICDRHHGIGADGLMVVADVSGERLDFHHYDPDGSRSFCLNGIRATLATLHLQERIPSQGKVHSEGVVLDYEIAGHVAVGLPKRSYRPVVWQGSGETIPGYFCEVGNPHFISWDVDELTFRQLAPRIRADYDAFPEGTNVNWLHQTKDGWQIRTYERGVENFTLSCGSGMYASALVLLGEQKLDEIKFLPEGKGEVATQWREDQLWVWGTACWVASGVWRCS